MVQARRLTSLRLLSNNATVRELDMLKENIPVDMVDYYQTYLEKLGVTKMEKTTYLRACKEGWAQPLQTMSKRLFGIAFTPHLKTR